MSAALTVTKHVPDLSVVVICSNIDEPVFTFQFPDIDVRLMTSSSCHSTNTL